MVRSRSEVEVKLEFDSIDEALHRVGALGARVVGPRTFEDNVLYDRDHDPLAPERKLLRLRRYGAQATLTFKAPVPGTHRHKVREEHETAVADPEALERVLSGLGFHPVYRYQKYRTLFEVGRLFICVDETPLGCYVELEGPPEEIDRAADRMGVPQERYVVETYRELHERAARARGKEPGDLVFEEGGEAES